MTALPPMTERSLPSTWPDSMQRTILKRNPMMADCRVSVTAHSPGDSSGTRMFQGTLKKFQLSCEQWMESLESLVRVTVEVAKNRPGLHQLCISLCQIHKVVFAG